MAIFRLLNTNQTNLYLKFFYINLLHTLRSVEIELSFSRLQLFQGFLLIIKLEDIDYINAIKAYIIN